MDIEPGLLSIEDLKQALLKVFDLKKITDLSSISIFERKVLNLTLVRRSMN